MSDGPFCGLMDQYYTHSKSLYTPTDKLNAIEYPIELKREPLTYQNMFVAARTKKYNVLKERLKKSDDKNRFEVGVEVLHQHYSFILKFYMYDEVSAEHDYPIASSFNKIYTTSMELVVSFPNQVFLSQKRPHGEVRLDHLEENDDVDIHFPGSTFAYTVFTQYVMQFDKQVIFDQFWIRLHRSPVVFLDKAQGPRTVWVYSQGQLVAETTFLLRSDEWYLIKPSSASSFVGDTLVLSE